MTNTITVMSELGVEDAIAWNNYYLENSPQWKTNWKMIRLVFMPVMVICFGMGIFYMFIAFDRNLLSTFIAAAIGILIGVFGFIYFLLYPKMIKRRIRKNAQVIYGRHSNSFVGIHKYSISLEGIRDNEDALVKWDAVEEIVQNDTHIFILVNPKKAVIIPKKSFKDTAAANRFVQDANSIFQAAKKTI
jgi:hypothetical protein